MPSYQSSIVHLRTMLGLKFVRAKHEGAASMDDKGNLQDTENFSEKFKRPRPKNCTSDLQCLE